MLRRWFNPQPNSVIADLSTQERFAMIEQLLKVVLDLTSAGMWEWDILHNTVYWSPELERMHGLEPGTFGGTFDHYFQMVHPDDRDRLQHALDVALKESGVFRLEYMFVHADGTMMPVEAHGVVLRDGSGAPLRMIGACSDITARRAYERSLDEYNATLEAILTAIPDPIYLKDSDGTYVLLNNAGLSMLEKYARKDAGETILGKKDTDLFTPELAQVFFEEDRAVLESGTKQSYESELMHDGHTYHFEVTKAPFALDAYGKKGIVVVCRDVTAKRREQLIASMLHEATSFLAESIETDTTLQNLARLTVPAFADWCSLIMLNEDGHITHSIEAERTHGEASTRTKDGEIKLAEPVPIVPEARMVHEVLQTGIAQLLNNCDDDSFLAYAPLLEKRNALNVLSPRSVMLVPLRVGNRSIGLLLLALVAADDGGRYTYTPEDLHFMEDIAHRAAIAIDHANLYQALKEESIQKDRFLSVLSHELRNPLAPVKNYLELFARDAVTQEEAPALYDEMLRQVNNMRRLLDDLLDLSRVVHNKITLDQSVQDIRTLIERSAAPVRQQFVDQDQSLEFILPTTPVWVNVDSLRFEQIVLNLLTNALRYSEPGGRTVVMLSEKDGQAVLSVKDTGIGIRPEMTASIFELFSQGTTICDSPRTSPSPQQGLGIGLTLVRDLVSLHGGSIEVVSEGEGMGSEFIVCFPTAESAELSQDDARTEEGSVTNDSVSATAVPDAAGGAVLVVDDNTQAAQSLALLLGTSGYSVTTAESGIEGMELARSGEWKAIILDIGLYDMDGYTIAETIREEGLCKEAVLIALTGYGLEADRVRAFESGFHHHLTKPVDVTRLESILREAEQSQLSIEQIE